MRGRHGGLAGLAPPLVLLVLLVGAVPAAGEVLLREEFTTLEAWRPVTFPKIPRHTSYTLEVEAGTGTTSLRADAEASASGLAWRRTYDVRAWPRLRWRWKVANVYEKGDATRRSGDDYPLRVYVVFAYEPGAAGVGKRLKYAIAKAARGEYPPDSGVSYVWASREDAPDALRSPYAESLAVIVKRRGKAQAGVWVEEEADVLADYRAAFGKDPPAEATLAVMGDADDTGERATAWLDWIEVSR